APGGRGTSPRAGPIPRPGPPAGRAGPPRLTGRRARARRQPPSPGRGGGPPAPGPSGRRAGRRRAASRPATGRRRRCGRCGPAPGQLFLPRVPARAAGQYRIFLRFVVARGVTAVREAGAGSEYSVLSTEYRVLLPLTFPAGGEGIEPATSRHCPTPGPVGQT